MIEFTVAIVRLYDLPNSFSAHVILLRRTASSCPCSLVTCSILVADVYQHKLVRAKVKVDIYPEEHSPRRRQSIVAGAKLCVSFAHASAAPRKQAGELKFPSVELSCSKIFTM